MQIMRFAAKAADRARESRRSGVASLRGAAEGVWLLPTSDCARVQHSERPGTVAEALEVLRAPMPESHPVALSFEVTETRGSPSAANRVTITSVERDDSKIHVNYDIVLPLGLGSHRPRGEPNPILAMTTGLSAAISGSPQAEGAPTSRTAPARAPAAAYDAATSPGSNHLLHPDHVGRVRDPDAVGRVALINLGGTSARSPRLACGLTEQR